MSPHDKDHLSIVPASIIEHQHETSGVQDGFQFPKWIWTTMLACYALFFIAIIGATRGSASALFAIVISIGFTVMFFGTASITNGVKGREKPSPLDMRGGVLQTCTGSMGLKAVAAQVLIVPVCLVLFAMSILIVRATASA